MGSNSRIPSPKEILGDPFLYLLWRIWDALVGIWILLGWAIAIIVMALGVFYGQYVVALVGAGIFAGWGITWGILIYDDED
ncbi:MAG: hypothetical protein Q8P04_00155 [bacterium]|nr:hypothetical protein [bacterium]